MNKSISTLALLGLATAPSFAEVISLDNPKPNIVLIFSDDVGFEEFGLYGVVEGESNTPNIDALAEQGVAFKTAWAQSISGPSRSMLYTGMYGASTGAYDNKLCWQPGEGELKDTEKFPALTRIIHDAGYNVGVAGKWHFAVGGNLGQDNDILGVDEYITWIQDPKTIEKITGYLPVMDEFDEVAAISGDPKLSRFWRPALVHNGEFVKTTKKDYGPDMLCDFVLDFIDRNVESDQPFFAVYPQVLAHGAHCPTPIDTLNGVVPNNVSDKSKYFRSQIRYADRLVGKVVDKLKEEGVWDNTILIYTSDNGTTASAKSKGVEYGVHIPFVVGGGLIEKRGLTDELIDFTDVLPTLAAFAGAEIPSKYKIDGVNIKPFLTGTSNETKDVIYSFPGVSSLIRTKDFLLEAVSPLSGNPHGRFYKTNGSFDGKDYENVTHDPKYKKERDRFEVLLSERPVNLPDSFDDPRWSECKSSKQGKNFWNDEKRLQKHHDLPKSYQFYDPSF